MRKRLALIFCLLLVSICGIFGCNNDPYSKMTINADGLSNDKVQQLYITQTLEEGNIAYVYDEIGFTVKVSGAGNDIDTKLMVSGWEGYIEKPNLEYLGNGITRITSKPLSVGEGATGKFTLNIKTAEGNKDLNVNFNIDLKLNNFYFKSSALQAVSNDYEVVLNDIEGLIEYYPSNSTQKDITYSVAVPTRGSQTGEYIINDRIDGSIIYHVDEVFEEYSEYKYAEVIVDKNTNKQILKIYPYLMTSTGKIALDNDGQPIPSSFPKIQQETTGQMEGIFYDCITLRAHSTSGDTSIPDKFLDVEVVPSAGEVVLAMNSKSGEDVFINKDSSGNYNVVLIDIDNKGGVLTSDEMSYYSQRDLTFFVKDPLQNMGVGTYLDDYEIIIKENIVPEDGLPVSISMIGNRDNFNVSSITAGTYTHTFILEHKVYKGLFTQEIKVNFKVLAIPFKISVNGNSISCAETNDIVTTIYNTYPRGSYGTKFKVDTNSDFKYFVFYFSDNEDTLSKTLKIRRDGDGAEVTFAVGKVLDDGTLYLHSPEEGYDYTNFGAKSSFYLSHSMSQIPEEPITIYIGIIFSMADSSYSQEITDNYFNKTLIYFPIHLQIENGLESIDFTQSSYKVNLNNQNYLYEENEFGEIVNYESGLKLWDLPVGRSYGSCVKSITYDESLINVYNVHNEETNTTSLYVKYVKDAPVGKTKIVIESFNGLTNSVWVENYIPTIYEYNGDMADGDTPIMPLACSVDKYSSGFLYYMTGLDSSNHEAKYTLYSTADDTAIGAYDSVATLFMIVNAEQRIKFFDYRIVNKKLIEIDITSKVRVSFSYSNYVTYENGVLKTYSLVTLDKDQPIIMTVTYTSGYEDFDENGNSIYKPLTMTHKIKIYIYEPLEGVEVISSKAVDLYIDNSLGYYNKDLSRHTIISTFIPNEIKLGSQWNDSDDWGLKWWNEEEQKYEYNHPVELRYEFEDLLNSVIINSKGQELKIKSNNSSAYRMVYYKDLFNVNVDKEKYECNVHNVISEDLYNWLNQNGYTNTELIDYILKQLFKENINFTVNVYINQFNKLQNINSVRFTAKYADRINQLKLNVEDDGVYFEVRKNASGEYIPNVSNIEIEYTIDNADVINKNISLYNFDTLYYYATVLPNPTGNSGKIVITPKITAGIGELTLTPEDNINTIENGVIVYYNESSNLLQSFRIKVADGSSQYPFEIRDVNDYQQMLEDIESGNYYHYVITRDINMNGFSLNNINITNDNNKNATTFSLSGKHTYIRNNQQITIYNSIYNLEINQTISSLNKDLNVGLFGLLENCVTMDNISIKNAYITIIDNSSSSYNVNIGILAGTIDGAILKACSVSGSIKVIRNNNELTTGMIVGGMVGKAVKSAVITGMPGDYEDGIVSTGNNSFVDIELALSQNFVANNSTVETNIAGGLVGISAGSTISNVQVVCNITTVVRANLGGLVGAVGLESVSTKVNEIDNAYVIPKIVANLNTTYNGTNTMGLNIGGVIGVAGLQGNTKYQLKNTIINFIDIGEEQYSWQDRTNIFVFAPNEKVSIGGLIGKENARTQEFKYNYVRSYYERDIDNNYQGNIYVIASSGSVGGLVGESFAGSGITFSYYDGDITASESLNTGMLIGSIANNFTLQYSYAIGLLNDLILKDIDEELVNVTTPVTKVDGDSGIFGSITYGETLGGSDIFGSNIAYVSTNQFNSFNTYGVINGYINYFAEGDKVYGINCKDAEGNPTTITSVLGIQYIYTFLKDTLSYKITLGEDPNLTAFQWFWYNSINSAKVGDRSISYPILLKDTNVMFDLVPSSISAKINERFGLYNITYDSLPQVIMYLNRYTSGSNDKTYYEISLNNENSAFEIKLDGAVVSTTYINANNLKLNDRVEFLENSNEGVIKIVGNKIYPVSIGLATLTIRSYVVKSVKLAINIIVVDGLTDYSVIADNSTLTPTEKAITGEEEVEFNKIYIDEQISININAINKDSNYIANSNFGVILEILDATDGTNTNNGIIKINGTEYSYNSDIEKNIILLNARDFKVSGVKLGIVKLSITPFIILDGVTYVDTYKSLTGIYQKDYNNIYILNKNANINTNLQKTYYFEVLARARSIENTRTEIALDSSNKVLFTTILETANLQIEEDRENNLATITILEDLFISINNKKFNATLNLKDITFDCTIVNNQYICDSSEFKSKVFGYEFDYTLINITFNDLVIVKTNTDVQARNNTYKISFNGYITFDRDFYRTNADMFDLNSAQFTFKITPKSNENISASTLVKIVPNEISTIFTNFYTKGEGSLNGEQIEYPEENESKFIVPGREGLLKITLDEEFNNSSYVTVTLDKKYFGYVTMQQLSAIVDAPANDNETGDILGYRNVISLEQINNNSYFGIRLSKLSLNYNDIHYFNNTYYIKILVNTSIQLSSLDLKITSYSVNDNVASEQYSNTCSLEIIELPKIKVTLEGEDYSVLGKGVRKELDIDYKGLTKNIEFSIIEKTDNKDYSDDFVYITDKEGNKVNELNLEYLNNGYKYYLNQDVLTPSGCEIEILFNADELILGVLETSKCTLYVDTVDFEIDEVKFCGTNNMLYLKFGENMMIDTQIIYRDIVVGVAEDINNFKENELKELIKLVQYEFAGIKWSELVEGKEQIKTNGKLKLQHRKTINNKIEFVDIELGSYGGITISQDLRLVGNYAYEFYEIIGTEISNDTYIRLDIDYYYNNGKLVIGDDALYVYNKTIDIQVIVEDNSTYDHPTPVEDQAKLLSICSVEKGNFILVNNIELKDWVPQEAKFDTLDGNGYTIKINSFDFSTIRGTTSANAGIFSTVSENTLLKNLTIDISPLLKSATALTNDVAIMRASSKNNYTYREDIIDLGYTNELNFGIIAGTNSGAITNAKVVCTVNTLEENKQDKYLHILTTQGYDNNKLIVSNIGGLVGVNAESGAISNSFIGVNISNTVTTENGINYYINGVVSPSSTPMDNQSDELSKIQIYPFTLAGGNNIGGLACINNGIISNCYAKGLGVFNTFPTVGDSATAGLVTYNNNVITSTFVEGNEIKNYRAEDNDFRLESTGYIGGLVYENNATIENSYSNVFVQTLSSFMGGFVFVNNANGTILNCYSTAVNRNSLATGQFTGVKQGVLQNFGSFTNCYYLVDSKNGEFANINEDAIEINNASTKFDDAGTWNGFAFVAGANVDGIWTIESGQTPRLASTLTDTNSFRRLIETVTDFENGNGVTFNYVYDTYYLGTKENPLIIDKAENFDKYIIDSAYEIEDKNIFGYRESENATRYVRIVNNLDFENITTAQEHKGLYLYKVTFVGVLDGNGMTLSNLNINTDSTELDNFGLFAQIGYEKSTMKAVVKNLNMSVRTFKSNGNKKTGILAGTIVNASIINVKIDGGNQTVSGLHMSGSLAGLIYATNNLDVSLIDVSIQNVRVEATHGSLGGTISERSEDKSRYFFNSFSVEREGQQSTDGYSFASLYNSETNSTNLFGENDNSNNVSYAGGVAGVILANNYNKEILDNNYSNYRTNPNESTIDNVIVCGNIVVSTADNAGGLFGYIGENTLIRNSKFVVSDGQLLKAFNFIGGIVGENHGIIEECTVAYSEIEQKEFDATILSDDRENGTFNLFDMSSGEPYYVVSIGGIAGYSKNGVILDSYVKVNVIKSLSYIAGGIVGYSEGYNYLGYVYNTGTVYGKYIIGGIIGLQINDGEKSDDNLKINNSIKMDQVISLTNWNAQSDTLNIRDNITKILFDNEKLLYQKDGSLGYDNFFIKMPEIGNLPINYFINSETGDNEPETIENNYRIGHTSYYVGSVVGKSLLRNTTNSGIVNGDTTDIDVYASYDLVYQLYANAKGVFSSTLGLMTTEGTIESGTRNDDYFKTNFTINGGEDNQINSLSYRIAYPTELNNYSPVENTDGDIKYLDKLNFNKVFTSQEYIQQLLGEYYSIEDGEGASKNTRNIFRYGTKETSNDDGETIINRYESGDIGVFPNADANVWDMADYLPTYASGVTTSIEKVIDEDDLNKAFSNSSSGKTYKILNDIEITYNETGSRYIQYYGGIKSLFVGENSPTITINLSDKSKTEPTKIATIFNIFNGAVLQNINFVINVNKTNFENSKIDTENYGILANTLDGVQITNCSFTIKVENNNEDEDKKIITYNNSVFNATNTAVLFGAVNNSTISRSTFSISAKNNISLSNTNISNFGLFAGSITRSTFNDCTFTLSDTNITINNCSDNLNIGGLAGEVYNSKFNNLKQEISDNWDEIKIVDNYSGDFKSIGSLFGYAYQLNLVGIEANNGGLSSTISSLNYSTQQKLEINQLNVALVAGKAESSKINNVVLSSSTSLQVVDNYSSITNYLNIGSIIGYEVKNSQLGKSGVVGSYTSMSSNINSYNLSVGGLVGLSGASSQLLNNAFVDNAINVTNDNTKTYIVGKEKTDKYGNKTIEYVEYYATSYVGGLLGSADGKVGVDSVVSASSITLTVPKAEGKVRSAIGGIIGGSNSAININNFASIGYLTLIDNGANDENDSIYKATYISGILGYNGGIFTGSNGYSYVELPRNSNTKTISSSITNGVVNGNTNVYYAQEFIGNNYLVDTTFYNFAMGDLYSQISQYSSISELTKVGGLTTQKVGNVQLIMPESIANGGYISRESNNSGDNKFDLCEITNSIKAYNVIPNNLGNNNEGFNGLSDGVGNNNVINENCIISGRSTEIGKVIITLPSNTNRLNTKHFVDTNNGVLSNVYLYTGNVDSVNNIALVKVNNGLITNVMVYGVSYANYTLTETNNGEIYSSVSSIKYMATSDTYTSELYGLVKTNNVTGIISDCYSNSFGYTESKDYITNVYGFAMTNYGNILNSTYFIPSSMEYDNVNCGFVKPLGEDASEEEKTKVDNSIIERCYQTAIPSNLLQRKSIWIEENNHCQIRGMKDIEGSIVTRIMIKIDGETEATEITSVKDLKDKITNNPGKYQLSYEYDFYVSADDMPEYTVVRVSRQSDLIDYISSLTNGYIPANTILLITNNFLSDNSESIKVDATKLNKISLNATSAIIGINTKNANNNITLDFNSSNASGQDVVQGIMEHELINVNNGLIAGITIANLEMKKINATARFATIATNNGTLDNVCFTKISVKGIGASFVAGMVSTNSTTGVINNCTIDVYVYSLTWVNRICTTNNGIINNTICTSISYDGDLYYGGV